MFLSVFWLFCRMTVLEVADVEVGGLGADVWRDPARRGMAVVNRQHRL